MSKVPLQASLHLLGELRAMASQTSRRLKPPPSADAAPAPGLADRELKVRLHSLS